MNLKELIPAFEDDGDILNREELDLDPRQLRLYQAALPAADAVRARVLRTDGLACASDDDFLAKLACVRRAFNVACALFGAGLEAGRLVQVISADDEKRGWMMGAGRELIAALIAKAAKDAGPFHKAYDDMLHYLHEPAALAEVPAPSSRGWGEAGERRECRWRRSWGVGGCRR